MIKRTLISIVLLLSPVLVPSSNAQEAPPPEVRAEEATITRQGVFRLLAFNIGPVVGMARGDIDFDAALAERNARRIAALAPMIPDVFAAMDTRTFDVETEALPVVWDNTDEFSDKARNLVEAANTFADIAAGGDQRATMGGVRALGGACGNCHDTFRVDDD